MAGVTEESDHVVRVERRAHRVVDAFPGHAPVLSSLTGRFLPQAQWFDESVGDAAGHERRAVVVERAVEEHADALTVFERKLRVFVLVPFLVGDERVFRRGGLVVPFAPGFAHRVLRVEDFLADAFDGQPGAVAAHVLDDLAYRVLGHRTVRRSFQRVVEQSEVHVFRTLALVVAVGVALGSVPCLAHPLSDAVLAIAVGVADVEHLDRDALLAFGRVAGKHAVHVAAAVGRVPVLRLVADHECRTSALQRQRRAGDRLDLPAVPHRVHVELAQLDAVVLACGRRQEAGQKLHGVLGLFLADRAHLHPRVRLVPADRISALGIPMVERQWGEARAACPSGRHRVLAPAFEPLQHGVVVQWASMVVQGPEPQPETRLFAGPLPRQSFG